MSARDATVNNRSTHDGVADAFTPKELEDFIIVRPLSWIARRKGPLATYEKEADGGPISFDLRYEDAEEDASSSINTQHERRVDVVKNWDAEESASPGVESASFSGKRS